MKQEKDADNGRISFRKCFLIILNLESAIWHMRSHSTKKILLKSPPYQNRDKIKNLKQ